MSDPEQVRRALDATAASSAEAKRLHQERLAIAHAKDLLSRLVDAAIASAPSILALAVGADAQDGGMRLAGHALEHLAGQEFGDKAREQLARFMGTKAP